MHRIAGALVLIAAASDLAGCRPDPVQAALAPLKRDAVVGRPITNTPGAQYHIDVRQEGHKLVCYVS